MSNQVPGVKGRKGSNKIPTYANPWSFRERVCRSVETIADLHGRPVERLFYRRGGVATSAPVLNEPCAPSENPLPLPRTSSLQELRRRQSATFARYRLAGWCTLLELETIEALWLEGLSLRQLARRAGVSPAAIGDRIERLSRKAPEFYHWWILKHRRRREIMRAFQDSLTD